MIFFAAGASAPLPAPKSRYNPMAYHNGSVWPHDNALIADGMARYGFTDKAMTVFNGLREASLLYGSASHAGTVLRLFEAPG